MPYFKDGTRSINFILVYKTTRLSTQLDIKKLETFLDGLLQIGFHLECDRFSEKSHIVFVKIHAPRETLLRYSILLNVDLTYRNASYRTLTKPPLRFMATPLTVSNPDDDISTRAPESVGACIPNDLTSAEKSVIVYAVLSRCRFGEGHDEYGLQRLLRSQVFVDAYPLHDGDYRWTETGPLNDRQLLAKYWGCPRYWYKAQPLNLIEKYFGAEYAFYFAWVGFYNEMLLYASVMSVIVLLYGVGTSMSPLNTVSPEICGSTIIMCPTCKYSSCKAQELENSCFMSYVSYIFNNKGSLAMAVAMSIWSTVFVELWQRREAVLKLQWNVKGVELDADARPHFSGKRKKRSEFTGELEEYMLKKEACVRYTVTLITVPILLILMVSGTLGVMIFRMTINVLIIMENEGDIVINKHSLFAELAGSILSFIFILIFKYVYQKIALWLTHFENHRTQMQFNNAYIFKIFAFAFTDNYTPALYVAFLKGRFFTHPGDRASWTDIRGLGSDICDPTGCMAELTISLVVFLVLHSLANQVIQLVCPFIHLLYVRKITKYEVSGELPQYKKEYIKRPMHQFFLVQEYVDMIIKFGYVIFFVMALPLAPLIALITNLIETRVDAVKMTRHHRRPIPNRVLALGAWLSIIRAMSYVSVTTNALAIAFTSDFIPKEVYRHLESFNLKGFFNTTISMFNFADVGIVYKDIKTCFYPGRRYPPDHPKRYQLTDDFWFLLALNVLFVVVFEHVVMLITGVIACSIPDIPLSISREISLQRKQEKELKLQALESRYKKTRQSKEKRNVNVLQL